MPNAHAKNLTNQTVKINLYSYSCIVFLNFVGPKIIWTKVFWTQNFLDLQSDPKKIMTEFFLGLFFVGPKYLKTQNFLKSFLLGANPFFMTLIFLSSAYVAISGPTS